MVRTPNQCQLQSLRHRPDHHHQAARRSAAAAAAPQVLTAALTCSAAQAIACAWTKQPWEIMDQTARSAQMVASRHQRLRRSLRQSPPLLQQARSTAASRRAPSRTAAYGRISQTSLSLSSGRDVRAKHRQVTLGLARQARASPTCTLRHLLLAREEIKLY